MNLAVMECFYLSKPIGDNGRTARGYRGRMHTLWKSRGYQSSEQRVCDQVRAIKMNGWLSEVELNEVRKRVLGVNDQQFESEWQQGEERTQRSSNSDETCEKDSNAVDVLDRRVNESNGVDRHVRRCREEMGESSLSSESKELMLEILSLRAKMRRSNKEYRFDFKRVDRKKLNEITIKVNNVVKFIETCDISETNDLIRKDGVFVADKLGLRNLNDDQRKRAEMIEPFWKRRIENDINVLRGNISVLDRKKKKELKNDKKYVVLEKKYNKIIMIKAKGLQVVIEELKQRLVAKRAKVKRYEQRLKQYSQNRLFSTDQKKLYQQLNGEFRKERVIPDAEESIKFWKGIWSVEKFHNRDAEWLKDLKSRSLCATQQDVLISEANVRQKCKRMPNWKTPGLMECKVFGQRG